MWWLLAGPVIGTVVGMIVHIKLEVRRLNRELTPVEDRSTDALKRLDMVDPDDPETWLLFLHGAELSR